MCKQIEVFSDYSLLRKPFLLLLLSVTTFLAGCSDTHQQIKETEQRGDKIIRALDQFFADNGKYPKSLSELTPKYLTEIPAPTWGLREWIYNGDGYILGVNETIYTGDGNSQWLRYQGAMSGWQKGD
jgi:hypothetical protein